MLGLVGEKENKGLKQKAIQTGSAFLLLMGIYLFIHLPLTHRLSSLKLELEKKQEQLLDVYRKREEVERFKRGEKEREEKLRYFFQRFPPEKGEIALLERLSELAKQEGVEKITFTLGEEKKHEFLKKEAREKKYFFSFSQKQKREKREKGKKNFSFSFQSPSKREEERGIVYYSLPVQMRLCGSYPSLVLFLHDLTDERKIKRLVKIERLEIRRGDDSSAFVEANISIQAYYFSSSNREERRGER